ncbi:hypothetical protein V1J52_04250 [Streptomyces sp. TRM 70351]|uniref:hypothetical protein n=1 Tax=Streptomyces sp. TRM 70351 TaxID=3116552 RepID=UPI002E7C3C85|nr:hypothetical protein [Streptomyces sp. TRM 70351]MEE1927401.1 hypothetical protein [Streptomyces sp. TRM 70351]
MRGLPDAASRAVVGAVMPPVVGVRRIVVTGRVVCVCRPVPPRTIAVGEVERVLVRRYVARLALLDGLPPVPGGCGPW